MTLQGVKSLQGWFFAGGVRKAGEAEFYSVPPRPIAAGTAFAQPRAKLGARFADAGSA